MRNAEHVMKSENMGYLTKPGTLVESFGACDVGITVFDSEKGTE